MQQTPYIWKNGQFIDWDKATTHVLSHTLHYGSGAFEGMRAYQTDRGPAIFRLPEHTKRLFYSAEQFGMQMPFTQEEINKAIIETVSKNKVQSCYIRPLVYHGYGKMGLNPKGADIDIIIACWPWGKYLGDDAINVKTSKYIRIHPKSTVADAKIVGHYVNSIMASQEIQNESEYQEALLLDYEGKIAEGPGENIFIAKNGVLFTPKKGTILEGITRSTLMTLAKDLHIEVVEKDLYPEDLKNADEAFFTGTAAEVTGIARIDDKVLSGGKIGELSKKCKDLYMDVVGGKVPKYSDWLTICG